MSHGWFTCGGCGNHYHETEHPSGLGDCPKCCKPVVGWAAVSHVKALGELTKISTPEGEVRRIGLLELSNICKATRNWYEAERIVLERYPREKKYQARADMVLEKNFEEGGMVWL